MKREQPDVSAAIRAKLAAGTLPTDAPLKVWAGYGNGRPCNACDLPITQQDIEYETDMPMIGASGSTRNASACGIRASDLPKAVARWLVPQPSP